MSTPDVLLNIASSARLFHTSDGSAFADLMINGHRETWPLRSKRFCAWLRQQYYERTWDAPAPAAMSAALNVLEAQAQFDGPEYKVSVRVAEHDGLIYLDLADEFWRCVVIEPGGWRIAEEPPVRFRRPAGLLPLPLPVRGGSIEALAPLLKLTRQDDLVLVVAWLLGALRACGPYPLLAISGEQGSAKTVMCKLLRGLIDPNAAPLRALPREDRELFIAAHNGHVLAFDNLSNLPPGLSDTLCRLASGGAFAARALYSNQDEVLFSAARPVILNGIHDFITRPDLADRAIMLTLSPIADTERRSEQTLWREFELARPHILGALLDGIVRGLRNYSQVRLARLPRMGDFALWAAACETTLWRAGSFERAYWLNRRTVVEDAVDADPVAAGIRTFIATREAWAGSASDLLSAMNEIRSAMGEASSAEWPKTPRALAGRLRRAQTFLRTLGVEIKFTREGRLGTRIIRIAATRGDLYSTTVSTVGTVRNSEFGWAEKARDSA